MKGKPKVKRMCQPQQCGPSRTLQLVLVISSLIFCSMCLTILKRPQQIFGVLEKTFMSRTLQTFLVICSLIFCSMCFTPHYIPQYTPHYTPHHPPHHTTPHTTDHIPNHTPHSKPHTAHHTTREFGDAERSSGKRCFFFLTAFNPGIRLSGDFFSTKPVELKVSAAYCT